MVGEKPFWDDDTNSVYYADFFGGAFYRYSYDEDKVYRMTVDDKRFTTFIQPIAGRKNHFLIGLGGTATIIKWDGHSPKATKVKDVFSITPNTNLNALMVDPKNNIVAGGFSNLFCANPVNLLMFHYDSQEKGLYTYDGFRYKTTIGLVLNEKKNVLYHLDACANILTAFDYNPKTGDICKYTFVVLKLDNSDMR